MRRLTVTLDDDELAFAKSYGAKHDLPLSRVVKIALGRLKEHSAEPDFVEAWGGQFKLRKRPGDPRYEYLKKKYEL